MTQPAQLPAYMLGEVVAPESPATTLFQVMQLQGSTSPFYATYCTAKSATIAESLVALLNAQDS
jgi:hypothetical protein